MIHLQEFKYYKVSGTIYCKINDFFSLSIHFIEETNLETQ